MGAVSGATGNILTGVGQGIGMTAIGLVAQAAGTVKGAIIDMNATLETSTLQFETLMGDADAARSHVADLFEFAKKTPFETQPVIDASRTLRTFGGSALDTMDNLNLFGNASAATSADIKDVSFWFGRAYAAMQGGQPYGEATMRLQELAVISPQVVQKLEALQKSGGSADAQWKLLTGDLNRFNGAMDRQASTWEGLTSTLSDSIKLTSAKMFQPLFKVAKQAVSSLNDVFTSDAFNQWADSAGQAIAGFVQGALDGIGKFIDVVKAIGTAFTSDKGAIGVVYDIIRKTFGDGVGDFVQPFLDGLMKFIPTLQQVGRWVSYAFQDLMRGDIKNFVTDIKIAFQSLTGIDLSGVFDAIGNGIDWLTGTGWPAMQGVLEAMGSFITKEVVPKLAELWSWVGEKSMAAWQWFTQEAWPAVLQILDQVKTFIETQVIPRLTDLATALQPALVKAWDAAKSAAEGFYGVLTTGQKPLQDAATDTGLLGIALSPLVSIGDSVARMFRAVYLIGGGVFDLLQKFAGWVQTLPAQVLAPLALIGLPFVVLWGQIAAFAKVLELASEAILAFAETAPGWAAAWDNMTTTVGNFFDMLGTLPGRIKQAGADIINGLIQGMASVDLGGWIQTNITNKIPDVVRDSLGIHSPSTVMAGIGNNLMQGLINGLTARLPDILSFMRNLSNVFGGTDVASWINAAISATGVPGSWAGPLSQIIQGESGGNPMAANLNDVNAQNGNASVGLMQLTGTNRATYTPAGMNPMDPVAQIIAGIRYIQDRYGDISAVPGVRSLAAGGRYLPYDAGGVLPPGLTLAANNTGANEFVMTPTQMSAMGNGVIITNNFQIDAQGAAPGVGEEISDALDEQANRMFGLLGSQLRVSFSNLAVEGGAT